MKVNPRPSADLPAVVWRMYVSADKSPAQTLKASAAWIAAQAKGVTL